ncbi:CBO0543 family protein [Paenibacillus sp. Soil766]|uniref:CBO0543 family protein n=1 Tax=Paenibacillus sp. Soil766 TaxID=1736404 RepID=UPI0039E136C7
MLATNLCFLFATFISRAFKEWKKYYQTMLFVSFCNLMYNLLCHDHLTWVYHPDFLLTHITTDLINTFVLLPSSTLMYLYFFPSKKIIQIMYYLGWIALFSVIEGWWHLYGRITYDFGWNFVWSIGFYFVMFYVIRIHHTNLVRALLISLISVVFLIIVFKIPISVE